MKVQKNQVEQKLPERGLQRATVMSKQVIPGAYIFVLFTFTGSRQSTTTQQEVKTNNSE